MDRRAFLKLSAAFAASAYLKQLPPVFAQESQRASVIVIGAGMAGLAAASVLSKQATVTVLEARQRMGGRIWTNRDFGAAVDLGAAWIHDIAENPIAQLAEQMGISTAVIDHGDRAVYDADGRELSQEDVRAHEKNFKRWLAQGKALAQTYERDISLGEALKHGLINENLSQNDRRYLQFSKQALVMETGAELEELSLAYSDAKTHFTGTEALFPQGHDALVRNLAQGLDIRYQQTVQKIEHGFEGVRVTTPQGSFDADAVIVTLPLGVLKKGVVRFDPPLPVDKQAAIYSLDMGVLNKVILRFPEIFWPKETTYLGYVSEKAGEYPKYLNMARYADQPLLMAFAGGEFARQIEFLSDKEILSQNMQILKNIFGRDIPTATGIRVTKWGSDPYAYGAYSYLSARSKPEAYDLLAEPLRHGRLFFAGEATSREFPGTVQGAYLSGIREAKRVLS